MGPPVGGLSGCRQGVFEPLAQGRHACVQKGGEKQPTRIDREMGITQKLVGKLIATLYLLSLSLPHPIWRLGSLCTSNSTQGVIQLRAKCRRFGDCCWFCSCCWCYHVVDVSKEASRASRFSALKASWCSASGARCRPQDWYGRDNFQWLTLGAAWVNIVPRPS